MTHWSQLWPPFFFSGRMSPRRYGRRPRRPGRFVPVAWSRGARARCTAWWIFSSDRLFHMCGKVVSPWQRAGDLVFSTMNSCFPSRLRHRLALTLPGEAMAKVGGRSLLSSRSRASRHNCSAPTFGPTWRPSRGSDSPSSRSWSRGLHSQATEAGGFVVSATLRVATVFYACRSFDRSPGMHSSPDDSKPELAEASPSDPRHSMNAQT